MAEFISDPQNQIMIAMGATVLSSIASSVLPDGHWLMKVVNVVALNVGKASNDSHKQ